MTARAPSLDLCEKKNGFKVIGFIYGHPDQSEDHIIGRRLKQWISAHCAPTYLFPISIW